MRISNPVVSWYLIFAPGYVILATILVHLVGSLILAVSVSGWTGFVAFPLLALFGWYLVFIEFFAVLLQWSLYLAFSFSERAFKGLLIVSGLVAPILAATFGPKEQGAELEWALGFGLGTAIAGVTSLLTLRLMVYLISYNLKRRKVLKSS